MFVVDLRDKSVKLIRGAEKDMKFDCYSEVQRVGCAHFVTIGGDANDNIHMVSMFASYDGSYFETRSIKKYRFL